MKMETKGITCKIPLDLHNRISGEMREKELFQKIKDYLEHYEQTYRRKLTQKQFVIGLIEQTLEEAEEEFEAAGAARQEEQAEEGGEAPETEDTTAGEGENAWDEETGGFEAHSEELEESTENEDSPYYA